MYMEVPGGMGALVTTKGLMRGWEHQKVLPWEDLWTKDMARWKPGGNTDVVCSRTETEEVEQGGAK